jgi:hypothetical protein
MQLRERETPLKVIEWRRVVKAMVNLLQLNFQEIGTDKPNYAHLREARLLMKSNYNWAGKDLE